MSIFICFFIFLSIFYKNTRIRTHIFPFRVFENGLLYYLTANAILCGKLVKVFEEAKF